MSQTIYEKNIKKMRPLMDQKKFNSDIKCSYYNVSAMILGMSSIRSLTETGTNKQAVFEDWEEKMNEIDATAKNIAASGDFAASIRYRTRMWERFEKIVSKKENLRGTSVAELDSASGR